MIDIEKEHLLLLSEAHEAVPGRPHVSTLIRWWRRGLKGKKLETVLIGGRRFTSAEALRRFFVATNQAGDVPTASDEIEAPTIEKRLDELRIR
jgi:hypothetical protein